MNTSRLTGGMLMGALLLAASGCGASSSGTSGSSSSDTVKVDIGGGRSVTIPKKPKIALIVSGAGNVINTVTGNAAKKTAEDAGFTLDVFDGKFDPVVQQGIIQTILAQKKYNVIALTAGDGKLLCKPMTETAPDANILTISDYVQLCGVDGTSATDTDPSHFTPDGVFAHISPSANYPSYSQFAANLVKYNPGPQHVLIVNGPPTNPASINLLKAVRDVAKSTTGWTVTNATTSYTPETAQKATQDALQAHPDISLIASGYSGLDDAIVQVLSQRGLTGKVPVATTTGGTSDDIKAVADGQVQFFAYTSGSNVGIATVNAVIDAVNGKTVPRVVYEGNKGAVEPYTGGAQYPTVTRENAASFKGYEVGWE